MKPRYPASADMTVPEHANLNDMVWITLATSATPDSASSLHLTEKLTSRTKHQITSIAIPYLRNLPQKWLQSQPSRRSL